MKQVYINSVRERVALFVQMLAILLLKSVICNFCLELVSGMSSFFTCEFLKRLVDEIWRCLDVSTNHVLNKSFQDTSPLEHAEILFR